MSIEKISKLLAQAENPAATREEAMVFFEKAQALATQMEIDLAVARMHTTNSQKREEPKRERFRIGAYRQHSNAHLIELMDMVCRNNGVKCLIWSGNQNVELIGMPSDIERTKALFSSLAVQMLRSADEYVNGTDEWRHDEMWSDRHYGYVPMTKQSARRSHWEGFRSEVGNRLYKAREDALKAHRATDTAGEPGTDIVMASKRAEVEKAMSTFFPKLGRGSWNGASQGQSAAARNAGREAGRTASIGARGSIGGSRTAIR